MNGERGSTRRARSTRADGPLIQERFVSWGSVTEAAMGHASRLLNRWFDAASDQGLHSTSMTYPI